MTNPYFSVFFNQILWIFLFDGVGPLGQWATVVVAAIALLFTTYFNWRNLKKKKRMLYAIDSQHHLFSANSKKSNWVNEKFQVRYKDTNNGYGNIDEPYLLMIKFKNSCKNVIEKDDFSSPIVLDLPQSVKILGEPVLDSPPFCKSLLKNIKCELINDGKGLELTISSIHPRHYFSLMVITDGNPHGFELGTYWRHEESKLEEANSDHHSDLWYVMLICLCLVCMVGTAGICMLIFAHLWEFVIIEGLVTLVGIMHFYSKVSKDNNHD